MEQHYRFSSCREKLIEHLLPGIVGLKVAKHVKGNSMGIKAERPDIRVIPKSKFRSMASAEEIFDALFESG